MEKDPEMKSSFVFVQNPSPHLPHPPTPTYYSVIPAARIIICNKIISPEISTPVVQINIVSPVHL